MQVDLVEYSTEIWYQSHAKDLLRESAGAHLFFNGPLRIRNGLALQLCGVVMICVGHGILIILPFWKSAS